MVEKIYVRPEEVRGLGNIVIPKSLEDYETYESVLAEGSDEVYGTVYTMSYNHVPDFDDIVLSSDKDILSYSDHDSTNVYCQLVDSQGAAVSYAGESVTFEVRKQSDDSLIETLTGETDSSGKATVSYLGKGAGDLNIKAECRLFSKTFAIRDIFFYDNCSTDKSNRYSVLSLQGGTSPTIDYDSTNQAIKLTTKDTNFFIVQPPVNATDNYCIEADLVNTVASDGNGLSVATGTGKGYACVIRDNEKIYTYENSAYKSKIELSPLGFSGTFHMKLEVNGTSLSIEFSQGTTVRTYTQTLPSEYSGNKLLGLVSGSPYTNQNLYYKNIEVYPL